jgi:hypothetical protein
MIVLLALWTFFTASFTLETLDYQECKKVDFKTEKCQAIMGRKHISGVR